MAETKARFLADTQKADTTAEAFTWPSGRATSNNHVLAMTDISAGTTGWQVTATAPTISGVTGELNVYESGSTGEDGGVLTLTGTDFGTQSDVDSIKIMDSSEANKVNASSFTVNSQTSITVTFNGGETGYNSWGTGGLASTNWHIQVTKSGLASNVFNSGKSFTQDPTIASVTQTASGDNNGTLTFNGTGGVFGSYGGQTAGGGQDSNTKLLLNFDRTGGTDIEDSSNTGGDGHKISASANAIIKASPFGDGKSAMFFDGTDDFLLVADSNDWHLGGTTNWTIEWWQYCTKSSGTNRPFSNSSSNSSGVIFYFTSGGEPHLLTGDGSNWKHDVTGSAGDIKFNQWQHIAITKATNTITIFIDGKQKATQTVSGMGDANVNGFTIGKWAYASHPDPFGGFIDEFRMVHSVVYDGDFDVPTSRLTAITNTKLLIHSDQSGGIGNGDRTNDIIVTASSGLLLNGNVNNLVDGNTNFDATDAADFNNVTGNITFNFKVPQVVNRFNWTQNTSGSYGTWSFAGSNDNSSFTTLTVAGGSDTTFTLDDSNAPNGTNFSFTNTTAYQYYKLTCSVVGSTSRWVNNITFDDTNNSSDDRNVFTDSATSGTTHTITPTGSYHSQGHGGIKPAMDWPASKKATGSAGVYFDGNGDEVDISASSDLARDSNDPFTFECWFYLTASGGQTIFESRDSDYSPQSLYINIQTTGNVYVRTNASGGIHLNSGSSGDIGTSRFYPNLNTWYHIAVCRGASGGGSSEGTVMRIYVNGRYLAKATDADLTTAGGHDWGLGHTHGTDDFSGYIDQVRWSNTVRYSHETLGSGNWPDSNMPQPTKIYGSPGPDNPSIGSIEIVTATDDDVNVTYSFQDGTEDNATVLGSSSDLAIASDSTGANKKKGTLTGTLQGNVGSVTNLRIQAKANNDSKRLVEVNETSGVGAIRLDKASNGKPVLFNARRYVGTGADRDINGFGFQPDLVWTKTRNIGYTHGLHDSVRGPNNILRSDVSNSEDSGNTGVNQSLTSFNSDGFSAGQDDDIGCINYADKTYIAWAWKAGGAPSGNGKTITDGTETTISSSSTFNASADMYDTDHVSTIKRSVNTAGGFSIVKWTNNGAYGNRAIPHGLGTKPDMVIIKPISVSQWLVSHKDNTGNSDLNAKYLALEGTGTGGSFATGTSASSNYHFYTSNDSSWDINASGSDVIMYCFKGVAGVSAFGSYTGATGGNKVTTNFRPRWIMTKASSNSSSYTSWTIIDAFRSDLLGSGTSELYADASPSTLATLYADQAKEENKRAGDTGASNTSVIIYDDGFKFTTGQDETNSTAGWTYIYMAFA